MTEMQSDERTNGEDQAKLRQVPLHERYGISQEDCLVVVAKSQYNRRKLDIAEDKIRRARDLVELLKDADEGTNELSRRTLEQLDRVQSLLKSAAKKIDKYDDEQRYRDVENWKQGGAS